MTSYFDDATREVSGLPEDEPTFIAHLILIEQRVAHEASLVTGDREFPTDLREKIQGIVATKAIQPSEGGLINERMRDFALVGRNSELLSDLHRAFHELAIRRVTTRFGLMFDSPTDILKSRDEHDSEV